MKPIENMPQGQNWTRIDIMQCQSILKRYCPVVYELRVDTKMVLPFVFGSGNQPLDVFTSCFFLLYWFIKCDHCYDNMVWDMTLYPDLSVCRRVDILFMLFVFVSVVVPHMSWLCEHRGECLIRDRNCLLVTTTWVHPGFLVRSMFLALFVLVPCLVYPVLSVSVDYPFLIATSVFSGVYFQKEAISPP